MLPSLQCSSPSPRHRELTNRSFSLSKRCVPRPLVVSELGSVTPSGKSVRTGHSFNLSFSPDHSLPVAFEPAAPKFKSPYLFSKVVVETEKLQALKGENALRDNAETAEEEGVTVPDIRTSATPVPDMCPACGLTFADAAVVERLREEDSEVVRDIKYSLEALKLLRILGLELNQESRKLHHHLLEQIKFAIFPLEENGKHSAVPFFSIYSALDAERKQLRLDLEAKEKGSDRQEVELKKVAAELSLAKSECREWRERAEEMKKKASDLSTEITRLTTTLVDIQQHIDTQETLSVHLASELKVKSRVFHHKERANHSLQLLREQEIAGLKKQLKAASRRDDSSLVATLQELHSLRAEVKSLKSDLQRISKLHEVMRKCYENDMKACKEYQRERTEELKIDEAPSTVKFMQRVKRNLQHYVTLGALINADIVEMSFDEVVELTAKCIDEYMKEMERLKTEVDHLRKQYVRLEVSKQALVEEVSELKSKLRFTEMYEENFQLRAAKNDNKFVGLGKTLDVPRYLRVSGFVTNLGLSKAQVETMVAEIWDMKSQWQNRIKKTTPMHIFLYNYLRNKFNYFPKVVEYGYNLMDGVERYSESPDCDLFLSVLKGELPEAAYTDNVRMVKLLQALLQSAHKQQPSSSDTLHSHEILRCLRAFFPQKAQKELDICRTLLDQDVIALHAKPHSVPFNRLFAKEVGRSHNRLVECVRKQMLMDLYRFYGKVSKLLMERSHKDTATVTVAQLIDALRAAEIGLEETEVREKLAPVLGAFMEDENTALGIEFVLRKLKAGYIRPATLYDAKALCNL